MMRSYARLLLAGLMACVSAPAPAHVTAPAPKPTPPPPTPHRGRVVVTTTSIEILEMHFVGATAQVAPESERFLDGIAHTLTTFDSIRLVEVQTYGSGGAPGERTALALRRARTVIDGLVHRGIDPSRLRAAGFANKPASVRGDLGLVIVNRTTSAPAAPPIFPLP